MNPDTQIPPIACPVHWGFIRTPRSAEDIPHCHQTGTAFVLGASPTDCAHLYASVLESVVKPDRIACLARDDEAMLSQPYDPSGDEPFHP